MKKGFKHLEERWLKGKREKIVFIIIGAFLFFSLYSYFQVNPQNKMSYPSELTKEQIESEYNDFTMPLIERPNYTFTSFGNILCDYNNGTQLFILRDQVVINDANLQYARDMNGTKINTLDINDIIDKNSLAFFRQIGTPTNCVYNAIKENALNKYILKNNGDLNDN